MVTKTLVAGVMVIATATFAMPIAATTSSAMPITQVSPTHLAFDSGTNAVEQVAWKKKRWKGGGGWNRHNGGGWKHNRWARNGNGWNRHHYAYGYGNHHHGHGNNNNWLLPYAAGVVTAPLFYGGYGGYRSGYYDGGYGYSGGGYSGGSHTRWCLNRYRSYDPGSDTYVGYDGYRHRCYAP